MNTEQNTKHAARKVHIHRQAEKKPYTHDINTSREEKVDIWKIQKEDQK